MKKGSIGAAIFALLVVGAMAPSAAGAAVHVSTRHQTYWHGVKAWAYVMSNPAVGTDAYKWVAVKAARADGQSWMTVGWTRRNVGGTTQPSVHWVHWNKDGIY